VRNAYIILVGGHRWENNIKVGLKETVCGLDSSESGIGSVEDSCEQGNTISDSIKGSMSFLNLIWGGSLVSLNFYRSVVFSGSMWFMPKAHAFLYSFITYLFKVSQAFVIKGFMM
jgi:hypothetical protein